MANKQKKKTVYRLVTPEEKVKQKQLRSENSLKSEQSVKIKEKNDSEEKVTVVVSPSDIKEKNEKRVEVSSFQHALVTAGNFYAFLMDKTEEGVKKAFKNGKRAFVSGVEKSLDNMEKRNADSLRVPASVMAVKDEIDEEKEATYIPEDDIMDADFRNAVKKERSLISIKNTLSSTKKLAETTEDKKESDSVPDSTDKEEISDIAAETIETDIPSDELSELSAVEHIQANDELTDQYESETEEIDLPEENEVSNISETAENEKQVLQETSLPEENKVSCDEEIPDISCDEQDTAEELLTEPEESKLISVEPDEISSSEIELKDESTDIESRTESITVSEESEADIFTDENSSEDGIPDTCGDEQDTTEELLTEPEETELVSVKSDEVGSSEIELNDESTDTESRSEIITVSEEAEANTFIDENCGDEIGAEIIPDVMEYPAENDSENNEIQDISMQISLQSDVSEDGKTADTGKAEESVNVSEEETSGTAEEAEQADESVSELSEKDLKQVIEVPAAEIHEIEKPTDSDIEPSVGNDQIAESSDSSDQNVSETPEPLFEELKTERTEEEKKSDTLSFNPADLKDFVDDGMPYQVREVMEINLEPKYIAVMSDEKASINPLKRLYDPVSCMYEQAASYSHQSRKGAVIRLALKYFLSSVIAVYSVAGILNERPFGFARMTFTDGSWIVARIVILGVITQMMICALQKLICRGEKGSYNKHLDIESESSFFIALIMMAAGALLMVNYWAAAVVFAAGLVTAVIMHVYAVELAYRSSRISTLAAIIIGCVLACGLTALYIQFLGTDVIRIIQSFIKF